MKFVHIADIHFDCPFRLLSDMGNFGDMRRLEQRNTFKKVIEYVRENDIPLLFISGDLYENEYIRKSTIEYINNLFKEIPNTKIFISPGNHDPYIKNSYYSKYNWSKNVKIFNSKIEKVELEDVNIYGYGFDDFYCTHSGIEDIKLDENNKLNILVIHGTLNAASIEDKQYNSISERLLREKGFDYVALGHIHKTNYIKSENRNIIYPGSLISMGFDELGKHGMIVGDIEKNNLNLEFISLDDREFKEVKLDCTNIYSEEDLIEKINELELVGNNLYKIILVSNRNFEINTNKIYNYEINNQIIKIKDQTKINIDFEKLVNENTLAGIFTNDLLERIKNCEDEEEKKVLERALEIGIDALKN